ncbi:MAG: hypothetical protein WCY82_08965 [Desulfotomaculaceae bacterium]
MDKNSTGQVSEEYNFADQRINAWIHFHGVVGDNQSLAVENAIVMVFACFNGGLEKPLAHTLTGDDGRYFISIPRPPDNPNLMKFKVRAGKPHLTRKSFYYQVIALKDPCTEQEPDTVQPCAEEMPEQNSTINKANLNMSGKDNSCAQTNCYRPVENHGVGLNNSGKAGEIEYHQIIYQQLHRLLPEKIIFRQPCQPPVLDILPIEPNVGLIKRIAYPPPKKEFTSAAFFYSYLAIFLFWLLMKK